VEFEADDYIRAGGHGNFPLPAQPGGSVIPSVSGFVDCGHLWVMYLLGNSRNNLTLMALTISTGFVVDDAIVMIGTSRGSSKKHEPHAAG